MAALRKGRIAAETDLHLGTAYTKGMRPRDRYQNLVAEPMVGFGHHGLRCQGLMCCVVRWLLTFLVTSILVLAGLEFLVTDTEVRQPDTFMESPAGHVQRFQSLTATEVAPYERDDVYEPNDNDSGLEGVRRYQLTMTMNVEVGVDDHLRLSLANQTGFFVVYNNGVRLRDGVPSSFDSVRDRVLDAADTALRNVGQPDQNGLVARRLSDSFGSNGQNDSKTGQHGWFSAMHERFRSWTTLIRRVVLGKSSNWMIGVMIFTTGFVACSCVAHMHMPSQGPYRPPHPSQHGPRANVHQSDAGPPFVGTATLKVPPSWSLERNHIYSLRSWVSDLVLWATATDLEPQRHGPIAALQVQGSAKELVRELTPQQLQHGDIDPQTGQQLPGLMLLVQVLARRYAPLEAENTTKSIAEFLSFRKMPGESIDSRCDMTYFGIVPRHGQVLR